MSERVAAAAKYDGSEFVTLLNKITVIEHDVVKLLSGMTTARQEAWLAKIRADVDDIRRENEKTGEVLKDREQSTRDPTHGKRHTA